LFSSSFDLELAIFFDAGATLAVTFFEAFLFARLFASSG